MMKMQELSGQVTQISADLPTLTETPTPQQNEEVRFFTSPKPVSRKTQLSITVFQLLTSAAFCLLLKACELLSPQLFANIHLYLERLFRW